MGMVLCMLFLLRQLQDSEGRDTGMLLRMNVPTFFTVMQQHLEQLLLPLHI